MSWWGPVTDWQYQVYLAHMKWENYDPNKDGPEFVGDPKIWERWNKKIQQARYSVPSGVQERKHERDRTRTSGSPSAR